jgi:hypothetical protein
MTIASSRGTIQSGDGFGTNNTSGGVQTNNPRSPRSEGFGTNTPPREGFLGTNNGTSSNRPGMAPRTTATLGMGRGVPYPPGVNPPLNVMVPASRGASR